MNWKPPWFRTSSLHIRLFSQADLLIQLKLQKATKGIKEPSHFKECLSLQKFCFVFEIFFFQVMPGDNLLRYSRSRQMFKYFVLVFLFVLWDQHLPHIIGWWKKLGYSWSQQFLIIRTCLFHAKQLWFVQCILYLLSNWLM